jgi:hypothetical protein
MVRHRIGDRGRLSLISSIIEELVATLSKEGKRCQAAGIEVALYRRVDLRMPSVACSTAIAEVSPRT